MLPRIQKFCSYVVVAVDADWAEAASVNVRRAELSGAEQSNFNSC